MFNITSEKCAIGLHSTGPATTPNKQQSNESNEFHSANNGNFARLQQEIKKSVRHRHNPDRNLINLTNHSFSRDTFKLLNKNLNFILTPDVYNGQKLDKELQNFYRLIKLKGYFKNTENQQPNDENQIFKAKTKEKWTPAENHHSIETFINLVENDAKNAPKNRLNQNLTKENWKH